MFHQLRVLAILLALAMIPLSLVMAQSSGSRGGLGEPGSHQNQLPDLDHKVAQRYITIEGSAEVRVAPTEIRVVLAVTDEGKTAPGLPAEHRDENQRSEGRVGKNENCPGEHRR